MSTIVHTIGRGIGYAAAASVHGACVAASATGQAGKDLVAGTKEGYVDHSARLAALRAQRPALNVQATKLAMTPVKGRARATA